MIDSKLFQAIKASDLLGCQWQKDASSPLSIISTVRESSSAAHSLSLSRTHTHPSLQSQTPRAVALSLLCNRPSCSSSSRTSDRLILFRARVVFLALLSLSRSHSRSLSPKCTEVRSSQQLGRELLAPLARHQCSSGAAEQLYSIARALDLDQQLHELDGDPRRLELGLHPTSQVHLEGLSLSLSHSFMFLSLLFGSLIGIFFHQSIDWIGLDWMLTMIRFPLNLSLSLSLSLSH